MRIEMPWLSDLRRRVESDEVGRLSMLVHNDCLFLAHHCMFVAHGYRDRLPPALRYVTSGVKT